MRSKRTTRCRYRTSSLCPFREFLVRASFRFLVPAPVTVSSSKSIPQGPLPFAAHCAAGYELILKQIIDCTPPSHEDYANLNNALETVRVLSQKSSFSLSLLPKDTSVCSFSVQEVANHLNKRRGEYENTTKMLELLKKISGITQVLFIAVSAPLC